LEIAVIARDPPTFSQIATVPEKNRKVIGSLVNKRSGVTRIALNVSGISGFARDENQPYFRKLPCCAAEASRDMSMRRVPSALALAYALETRTWGHSGEQYLTKLRAQTQVCCSPYLTESVGRGPPKTMGRG
jgi:hypothetical protein